MKFEWEKIFKIGSKDEQSITYRSKVIGGWLVRQIHIQKLKYKEKRTESLVFIPDEKHVWEIDKQ